MNDFRKLLTDKLWYLKQAQTLLLTKAHIHTGNERDPQRIID